MVPSTLLSEAKFEQSREQYSERAVSYVVASIYEFEDAFIKGQLLKLTSVVVFDFYEAQPFHNGITKKCSS